MCHICHPVNEEHTIRWLLQKAPFQINPPTSAGITWLFAGLQSRSLHPTDTSAPCALELLTCSNLSKWSKLWFNPCLCLRGFSFLHTPPWTVPELPALRWYFGDWENSVLLILTPFSTVCPPLPKPFSSLSFLISPKPVLDFTFLFLPNLLLICGPCNIFLSPCLRDHRHHRSVFIWAPLSLLWTASHNQKKQLRSPTQSCYFWMEDATLLCRGGFNWYFFPKINLPFLV